MKRRKLLKGLALLPLAGTSFSNVISGPAIAETKLPKRDILSELDLRTFINAAGTYTSMTASLMPSEVLDAINTSAKEFIMLDEVQDKAGARIAEMCHAEAATVTAGCWSAMVLGMAGVLTGNDLKKIALLPHIRDTSLKSEVILQKTHMNGYEHALTNTGVTLIPVETKEETEKAVNEKTALMWFLNREAPAGQIQHEEWLTLAKKYSIPTMIDIAADVPPVENLWKYNDLGFDLVCISGGKAICGPQSSGILMGKKDLVAAARLNAPPRGGNIGRGMKVNKEEVIGMYVALDSYIKRDHKKEWQTWEDKIAAINNTVKKIPGVQTEVVVPPVANHTPSLEIGWDPAKIKLTPKELGTRLSEGSPSIEVVSWEKDDSIKVTVFMLKTGQEKIVAQRIHDELLKAAT